MIILLDTSTAVCKLDIVVGDNVLSYEWESGRQLAKGLLSFIKDCLDKNDYKWDDISGLGVFEGPGSFTGLRIGLTTMNTIASARKVPIVASKGDGWRGEVLSKLNAGHDVKITLPYYGSEPKITASKK